MKFTIRNLLLVTLIAALGRTRRFRFIVANRNPFCHNA
jgi:hypothetical protein